MRPALLVPLLLAACGDSTGPEGALEQALARARPVSPSALGATAATTWEAPVPLPELSAHGLTIEAELLLEANGVRHRVVIERKVARQQRRFRVSERRTHEQPSASDPTRSLTHGESFEAVFDGERLAMRRGEGRWIERDAREGLPARVLTRLHDLVPFVLTALDDYLVTTPRSPREGEAAAIAALPVAWHELALDHGVAPRPMPPEELRALRDHDQHVGAWLAASFQPTSARGRLASVTRPRPKDAPAFDPAATLELELALSGPVKLEGGAGTLAITLTQRVTGLDGVDFTLPADRLPESRERPWKMIEDVLGDDLLDPYRPR